jgi:hypothetical protein
MYAGSGEGPQSNGYLDQFLRVIFPVEWEEYASNVKCIKYRPILSCTAHYVLSTFTCRTSLFCVPKVSGPASAEPHDHYDCIVMGSGHASSCAGQSNETEG